MQRADTQIPLRSSSPASSEAQPDHCRKMFKRWEARDTVSTQHRESHPQCMQYPPKRNVGERRKERWGRRESSAFKKQPRRSSEEERRGAEEGPKSLQPAENRRRKSTRMITLDLNHFGFQRAGRPDRRKKSGEDRKRKRKSFQSNAAAATACQNDDRIQTYSRSPLLRDNVPHSLLSALTAKTCFICTQPQNAFYSLALRGHRANAKKANTW